MLKVKSKMAAVDYIRTHDRPYIKLMKAECIVR